MADMTKIPPRCRSELILRDLGDGAGHVVKDPATRTYFQLGDHEAFLLRQLNGESAPEKICLEFERQFQDPLTLDELRDFIELAESRNFLENAAETKTRREPIRGKVRQALYWRKRIIDPDRLLGWLAPRMGFLFTSAFVLGSLLFILAAGAAFFPHRAEFIRYIPRTWESFFFAWLTVGLATACHEMAHGLACKRFGGEVHEIGFMMMFFIPCFYCDISDAWLFREKSKRLWVTLAGTYCDLCLWAVSVFVWRCALPETVPGALSSIVVSVCGLRVFVNAIPLFKLDGYYFLSDLLEIPNLRSRSSDRLGDHVRWLFWGGNRPETESRGKTLLVLGLVSWCFSITFLVWMLVSLTRYLGIKWGLGGLAGVAFLGWLSIPSLLAGFSKGEIMKMFFARRLRTLLWLISLGGVASFLVFFPMQERATGQFRVRPSSRAEIRAPASAFLRVVHHGEGQSVQTNSPVVLLDIPDLASKILEKKAEIGEAAAKLKLLEAGPRKEEIHEQRLKVTRAKDWRTLAEQDLVRKRKALEEELTRLNETIRQHNVELENARENLSQSRLLVEKKALALDQLREWDKKHQIAQSLVNQAEAQRRERVTLGTQEQEGELARREKELADAASALSLLEIGTRQEEVEAQRSHLARLEEAGNYLRTLRDKLRVGSPIAGVVVTPYLNEKIGQFFKEGDLICEVENTQELEVEIPLLEQEVGHVRIGYPVDLKARAMPFHTLRAEVHRIAPAAAKAEKPELTSTSQNTITVYCRLTEESHELSSGMTGYARIYCGQYSIGRVLGGQLLRYLRTEFWF